MSSLSVGLRYLPLHRRGHTTDLESPFKNLIYIEEFRRGQTKASIFEAPPFKMHYAGRRSTIGGGDGHEQKGKRKRKRERERVDRTRLRGGERRNDLDGECERNDERENERRGEDRRRKRQRRRERGEEGRGKRERERDALARKEQRDGCRGRGVTEGQRKLVPDPI